MGGIFSGLFGWLQEKSKARVLVLGLDAAGKTTVIRHLQQGVYVEQVPTTISFNLEHVNVGNLQLEIWDLGGQDRVRPYWRYYYPGTLGILFVVDSADADRMELCASELHALLKEPELQKVPIAIFANKKDLGNTMTVESITDKLQLSKIREREWTILPGSALNGEGIRDVFKWLSDTIEASL